MSGDVTEKVPLPEPVAALVIDHLRDDKETLSRPDEWVDLQRHVEGVSVCDLHTRAQVEHYGRECAKAERAALLAELEVVVTSYPASTAVQAGITGDMDQWARQRGEHL